MFFVFFCCCFTYLLTCKAFFDQFNSYFALRRWNKYAQYKVKIVIKITICRFAQMSLHPMWAIIIFTLHIIWFYLPSQFFFICQSISIYTSINHFCFQWWSCKRLQTKLFLGLNFWNGNDHYSFVFVSFNNTDPFDQISYAIFAERERKIKIDESLITNHKTCTQ